jgi:hypothetical protein
MQKLLTAGIASWQQQVPYANKRREGSQQHNQLEHQGTPTAVKPRGIFPTAGNASNAGTPTTAEILTMAGTPEMQQQSGDSRDMNSSRSHIFFLTPVICVMYGNLMITKSAP